MRRVEQVNPSETRRIMVKAHSCCTKGVHGAHSEIFERENYNAALVSIRMIAERVWTMKCDCAADLAGEQSR